MSTTTITHTPETIQLRKDIESLGKRNARQFQIIEHLLEELKNAGKDINVLDIQTKDDIKPEPVYRPWTADEVPLGAWMRKKSNPDRRWLLDSNYSQETRDTLLTHHEHSTDGGKTWLPCGVEEGAE